MGVDLGGARVRVAQLLLHRSDIDTSCQQMGGKGMAQRMATDRFMQLSLTRSLSHGFLQCGWVHMVATQGVVRWVMTQFAGREQVVPAQLQRSIRVFASQRERKMHSGIVWNLAVRQKVALHIGNLLTQRLEQFRGEGYRRCLPPLAFQMLMHR